MGTWLFGLGTPLSEYPLFWGLSGLDNPSQGTPSLGTWVWVPPGLGTWVWVPQIWEYQFWVPLVRVPLVCVPPGSRVLTVSVTPCSFPHCLGTPGQLLVLEPPCLGTLRLGTPSLSTPVWIRTSVPWSSLVYSIPTNLRVMQDLLLFPFVLTLSTSGYMERDLAS